VTPSDRSTGDLRPGLTLRSLSVSVVGLFCVAWIAVTAGSMIGYDRVSAMEALAIPALAVLLSVVAIIGMCRWFLGRSILSQPETICITYLLLIAAPMINLAFWVPTFAIPTAHLKQARWDVFEIVPEKLTAGGPELVANGLDSTRWNAQGAGLSTREAIYKQREAGDVLALENAGDRVAAAELDLRLVDDGLFHNAQYLFTSLIRVTSEDPNIGWTVELWPDEGEFPVELIRGRGPTKPTYQYPHGFERRGNFAFVIPRTTQEQVTLRISLTGPGTLELADPHLRDITPISSGMSGMPVIKRSDFEALPESKRAGYIVRPDNLMSPAGVAYLVSGPVPWRYWTQPLTWWTLFIVCTLGAFLGIAAIMRRQWVERERYPLPLTYPIQDLVGRPEDGEPRRWPALFHSYWFWGGFFAAAFLCGMKILHGFNPSAPELLPSISLSTYLRGAGWGDTWDNVNFTVFPFALGIGLLLELNVLISLVIGFFLYRFQLVLGHQTGWDADSDYPYGKSQSLGAFVFYGLTVLILLRKYLGRTLSAALRGGNEEREPISYRSSYALLILGAVGLVAWSLAMDFTFAGALVCTFVMLLVGFVYMKLRAECGPPGIAFLGVNGEAGYFIPLVAGLAVIGPVAFGMSKLMTPMLGAFSFLILGGLILEFLEMSKRYHIKRLHVPGVIVAAILGAVLIGGWVTLSGLYSTGSENYTHSTQYSNSRQTADVAAGFQEATNAMDPTAPPAKTKPDAYAFFFGGAGATVLTIIRQMFAGFWFHPAGFILGPSVLMMGAWGSLFVAWVVRLAVLRVAGASTVREKLRPTAIGIIAGSVVAYVLAFLINYSIWIQSPGKDLFEGLFAPGL